VAPLSAATLPANGFASTDQLSAQVGAYPDTKRSFTTPVWFSNGELQAVIPAGIAGKKALVSVSSATHTQSYNVLVSRLPSPKPLAPAGQLTLALLQQANTWVQQASQTAGTVLAASLPALLQNISDASTAVSSLLASKKARVQLASADGKQLIATSASLKLADRLILTAMENSGVAITAGLDFSGTVGVVTGALALIGGPAPASAAAWLGGVAASAAAVAWLSLELSSQSTPGFGQAFFDSATDAIGTFASETSAAFAGNLATQVQNIQAAGDQLLATQT